MNDANGDWLDRIRGTMAVDIGRGISAGLEPEAIVAMLLEIPEVDQALRMRADRRFVPADVLLTDAADFLDNGSHKSTADRLRTIAAGLGPVGQN